MSGVAPSITTTNINPKVQGEVTSRVIKTININCNDARRVEIFNDKDYLKEMRQSRGKRRRRRKRDDKSEVDDPDRPRSLGRLFLF